MSGITIINKDTPKSVIQIQLENFIEVGKIDVIDDYDNTPLILAIEESKCEEFSESFSIGAFGMQITFEL